MDTKYCTAIPKIEGVTGALGKGGRPCTGLSGIRIFWFRHTCLMFGTANRQDFSLDLMFQKKDTS